jgi:hypothetical protein
MSRLVVTLDRMTYLETSRPDGLHDRTTASRRNARQTVASRMTSQVSPLDYRVFYELVSARPASSFCSTDVEPLHLNGLPSDQA